MCCLPSRRQPQPNRRRKWRGSECCAPTRATPAHNERFLDELRKLGWVEGTTIVIERKDPDYRLDQLPALAADLVRSKPDLIVAFAPQPVRAAKEATSDIPIVMLFVADPVGLGLCVKPCLSWRKPDWCRHAGSGRFQREAAWHSSRGFATGEARGSFHQSFKRDPSAAISGDAPPAAAKLGFQLDVFEVREAGKCLALLPPPKPGCGGFVPMWLTRSFPSPPNRVPDLAAQAGLPSISLMGSFAQAGGLISYGPDFLRLGSTWGSLCRSNSERRQTGRASD